MSDDVVNGDMHQPQQDVPEWAADLDESLKQAKSLHKFTGEKWKESLVKSYLEAEKELSRRVPVPRDDAPDEEWDKFFNRFRPKDVSQYDIPEGVDKDLAETLRQEAYERGVSKKQFASLMKRLQGFVSERSQQVTKTKEELRQKAQAELARAVSGADGDPVVRLTATIQKAFPHAAERIVSYAMEDPDVMSDVAALYKQYANDSFVSGKTTASVSSHPYKWMEEYFSHK